MDPMSAILVTFGVILVLAGWIQLIITSFNEDFTWGLSTVFLPPLSYLYGFMAWDKAGGAMQLTIIGWLLILANLIV